MNEAVNGDTKYKANIVKNLPGVTSDGDAWDLLDALAGTIEGPKDWSEQLAHYTYGTPKLG